jgi:lipopolysaccharide transport system ATP-binding protein
MLPSDIAIRVENISKCYRIGVSDIVRDNFASAAFHFLKKPISNYRKYRSLYTFDDIASGGNGSGPSPSDIIWALRDVSFEVKRGEVLGIVGRNGAGKSTLLKVLSRITHPTTGRALVQGKISSLLEVGTGFHPELSGRENVYLNATILGMRKKEVDRKYDEIVEFSGIEKFMETPVKRYSSGMKVRLAFSVAAHLEPDILVIDEVLAVGDADFQKKCLNKMDEVGTSGRTVLFVSHNMPAVTRLCTRALLMEEGRIIEEGTAEGIVRSYLNSGTGTSAYREWNDPAAAPGAKWAACEPFASKTAPATSPRRSTSGSL